MTEDLYIIYEKEQVQIINSVPQPEIIKQLDSISDQPVANELVQEPKELIEMPVTSETTREFSYLGENNKYFLILFNEPNQKDISSIQKETLLKIMSAKGMELRDRARKMGSCP